MKPVQKFLLLCALGLTLILALVLNIRGTDFSVSQDAAGLTETALQPAEIAKHLPTSDVRSGVLAESLLVQAAYWVAISSGMDRSTSLADLDASKAVHTTYRQYLSMSSGNPETGDFVASSPDRPLFILPVTGSGFQSLVFLPNPNVPEPTMPSFHAVVVVLYADTAEEVGIYFVPDGVSIPDFSALDIPVKVSTPEAGDIIPLPPTLAVPTPPADTLRGSS